MDEINKSKKERKKNIKKKEWKNEIILILALIGLILTMYFCLNKAFLGLIRTIQKSKKNLEKTKMGYN